jgi:hypothetical protein
VLNTNDEPTLADAIGDQTATEDQAFTFTVPGATFADVDAADDDALTYAAKLASGGALPAWLTLRRRHAHASAARRANGDVGADRRQVDQPPGTSAGAEASGTLQG